MSKAELMVKKNRGATATEYALMIVGILLVCAAAFKTLGQKVNDAATSAQTAVTSGG
jgi:Flp pilus assembly pilin Flp